ncbi:MAG TPA: YihY/virulence factor BrkB family protein [Anaerolineales bacterium]
MRIPQQITRRLPEWTQRPIGVLAQTFRSFGEDECALRAAALAYHTLLSFFPLLLFLLYIASRTIQSDVSEAALIGYIGRAIPQLAETTAELIAQAVDASASFGVIGAIGLLWSASAVFSVLAATFNVIWDAEPRPVWRGRLVGLVAVLSLAGLFLVSLVLRTLAIVELPDIGALGRQPWARLTDLGLTIALCWILYLWLPNRQVNMRHALAAAVTAGSLWQVAKWGFSLYLEVGLSQLGVVYGSIGSVIVLVLWVYASSLILFLGAELGACLAKDGRLRER